MRVLYCWRCGTDAPMIDEREFEAWHSVFERCLFSAKSHRNAQGATLPESGIDSFFAEARAFYSETSGAPETHQNEIWHHRLSMFGPPCTGCGKPLRTPQAKLCAECGQTRSEGAA